MKSTMGHARRVTDAQVEIILAWQRNRRSFDDWARIFGYAGRGETPKETFLIIREKSLSLEKRPEGAQCAVVTGERIFREWAAQRWAAAGR